MKKGLKSLVVAILALCLVQPTFCVQASGYAATLTVYRRGISDERWADSLYGSGQKIKSSGAALLCIMMVYNYYQNEKVTPVEMDEMIQNLSDSGNYKTNSNMPWAKLGSLGLNLEGFYYSDSDMEKWGDMFNLIKSNINHSRPVILHLTKGESNHYVLAIGYEGMSVVKIADPGGYNRKTLSEAEEAGWRVEDLIVLIQE